MFVSTDYLQAARGELSFLKSICVKYYVSEALQPRVLSLLGEAEVNLDWFIGKCADPSYMTPDGKCRFQNWSSEGEKRKGLAVAQVSGANKIWKNEYAEGNTQKITRLTKELEECKKRCPAPSGNNGQGGEQAPLNGNAK